MIICDHRVSRKKRHIWTILLNKYHKTIARINEITHPFKQKDKDICALTFQI